MKKIRLMVSIIIVVFLLVSIRGELSAGVVFEVETTYHSGSSPRVETAEMAVEGVMLKMEILPSEDGVPGKTVIFNSRLMEYSVIFPAKKKYIVFNMKTINMLNGQRDRSLSAKQQILNRMPEHKRKAYQKMLEKRKKSQPRSEAVSSIAAAVETAGPVGVKVGDSIKVNGNRYPCNKSEKTQMNRDKLIVWQTPLKNIDGSIEAVQTIKDFKAFNIALKRALKKIKKKSESIETVKIINAYRDFFDELNEDGFPVQMEEYDSKGNLEEEWKLRSAKRRTLDPSEFEPPSGYKRRSMLPEEIQ